MATTAAAAATKLHLIKGDRHLFSTSDDSAVIRQIVATHSPDGRDVDTRPLMRLIEDILRRATPTVVVAVDIYRRLFVRLNHFVLDLMSLSW